MSLTFSVLVADRGTGIDHHVRLAMLQQQGGAYGRRDFADTGFQ